MAFSGRELSEGSYLVDDFARLLVEVIDEIFEVGLSTHTGLRMRDAAHIITLQQEDGGEDGIGLFFVGLAAVEGCCHAFGEELATDVVDGFFEIFFVSHDDGVLSVRVCVMFFRNVHSVLQI